MILGCCPTGNSWTELTSEAGNGNLVDQMAMKDGDFFYGRVVLAALSHGTNSCRVLDNSDVAFFHFRLKQNNTQAWVSWEARRCGRSPARRRSR